MSDTIKDYLLDILMHEGVARRSGRYPWGSGKNPNQRTPDFLSRVEELKKLGKSEDEIAADMELTSAQFRIQRSLANSDRRRMLQQTARTLRDDGLSLDQIAKKMGYANDSSVRSLLDERAEARMNASRRTAEFLKEQVDKKGMIEVGSGVNLNENLRVSKEKMKEALYLLELEGYPTWSGRVPQVTNPGKMTTITVLCPPGTPHSEIYKLDKINQLGNEFISRDGGESFNTFIYPKSMDSNRIKVRYAEEGGKDKDGVIEIRRNVPDLSLGESRYAQVRILVDDKKYLKGMAMYSDDIPDGYDVVFNTNKKSGIPKMDVLKNIGKDPDNPFGSLIKSPGGQSFYDDPNGEYTNPITGKKQSLSLINKRAEEGDWDDWSDHLSAQFLSKQKRELIKKQIDLATADKVSEFEEIKSLTNPTVKKVLLNSFSDDCDSAAVHLQAAALPRQKYKVILPLNTLKDNEVYAPTYQPGEQVALVRYPHGGTFEIPILTVVNRKHPEGNKALGNAADAIGINSKVAERLSGADFDGDTVMVIPTGKKVNITSTPPLKGLEGFDAKAQYQADRIEKDANGRERYFRGDIEFKPMKNTQTEMGIISNLITDMTLKGAADSELARAVRHSMVVIDAEKHKLDYRQSEIDNQIPALKKTWQGHIGDDGKYHEGSSTLISRSKSEVSVPKRKGSPQINPETGEITYKLAKDEYEVIRYKDPETGKLVKPTAGQLKKYKMEVSKGKTPKDFVVETRSDGEYEIIKYRNPVTGKIVKPSKEKYIDPTTGKETSDYIELVKSYRKAVENGDNTDDFVVEIKERMQTSTKMAEAKDAMSLSSGTPKERIYAEYANQMKALANTARKEMISTKDIKYSPSAKETYRAEVATLNAKLNNSLKNAPRERYAQIMANTIVKAKEADNPEMSKSEKKKISQQELAKARAAVGAKRTPIEITDREWEAIQAGAITPNILTKIINNVDMDELRRRATPRATATLSSFQKNKIKAMAASGYSTYEIAEAIGKSTSSINNYLLGKGVNQDE